MSSRNEKLSKHILRKTYVGIHWENTLPLRVGKKWYVSIVVWQHVITTFELWVKVAKNPNVTPQLPLQVSTRIQTNRLNQIQYPNASIMKYHHIKKTSNTPSTNHRRISNTHGVTTLTPLADLETWPVVLREAHSASSSPCPVRLHALSKKEILRGGNLIYIYDVYVYIYIFLCHIIWTYLYIYNMYYMCISYLYSITFPLLIVKCAFRNAQRVRKLMEVDN